jgi:peptidoglycan/LPS O-acetylase OafA/YrhL
MNNNKIQFAHNLRGFAALVVVISHLCGVFWYNQVAVETIANVDKYTGTIPNIVKYLNHFSWLNYGYFGVALFFIISGFVIPFSLKKYNAIQFLIARFFRIYPVYIIGFLVSLLSIYLGGKYFGKSFPHSFNLVLKNISFFRDIFWVPSIDGIVWTLEIEFKFYLLCSVLISTIINARVLRLMFVNLLLAVVFLLGVFLKCNSVLFYVYELNSPIITFMFIGTIFFYLYHKMISKKRAVFCILLLFLSFSLQWYYGMYSASTRGVILNYSLALMLFLFFYIFRYQIVFPPLFSWLADISYPLYVVHGPFSYVFMRVLLDNHINPTLTILISCIGSILIAFFLHSTIEIKFTKLGKKLAIMN